MVVPNPTVMRGDFLIKIWVFALCKFGIRDPVICNSERIYKPEVATSTGRFTLHEPSQQGVHWFINSSPSLDYLHRLSMDSYSLFWKTDSLQKYPSDDGMKHLLDSHNSMKLYLKPSEEYNANANLSKFQSRDHVCLVSGPMTTLCIKMRLFCRHFNIYDTLGASAILTAWR